MLKLFSLRTLALTTVAAIGLGGAASSAIAARLNLESARAGAAPSDVLPAISKPRPYQRSLIVTCDKQSQVAEPNTCLMALGPVPAGHLLEISTINCFGGGGVGATAILKNRLKMEAAYLVGFFPDSTTLPIGVATGPYYFKAGDKPYLVRGAGNNTATASCMVHGTLWETP